MESYLKNYMSIFILTISIFLSACNYGDTYFSSENTTIEGILVDGYIQDASVCAALGDNLECSYSSDSLTNDEGEFTITDVNASQDIITLISSGGIDTATDFEVEESFRKTLEIYDLPLKSIITPLSDLISLSYFYNNISLTDSKEQIATNLSIDQNIIYEDPMTNISLFFKVQELQNLKKLLTTLTITLLIENNIAYEEAVVLQKVKSAIITQISSFQTLDQFIEKVLTTLEFEYGATFNDEQKEFIQIILLKYQDSLTTLKQNSIITIDILERLQKLLELQRRSVANLIIASDYNTTLAPLDLALLSNELIETDFNQTNAILDPLACSEESNQNYMDDSSLDPDSKSDISNGISIRSILPYSSYVDSTKVRLYYPNLHEEKTSTQTVIFSDEYYFAFDTSFIENSDKTVYIRVPEDENTTMYSCYRYTLSSTNAEALLPTKVYRYNDINSTIY